MDVSCAHHKALSAIDAVRIEMELRVKWVEEAVMDAVRSWEMQVKAQKEERRGSLAREAAAKVERELRVEQKRRAREKLHAEASMCQACVDMDCIIGGLCDAHMDKLETLCAEAGPAPPAHAALTAGAAPLLC